MGVSPPAGARAPQHRGGAEPQGGGDLDAWDRLRALDPAAIGLLFDRHAHAVYNFAFRRTASWSMAEDVVQATFTTLWRKATDRSLPALSHASALPWLLGVASHEGRNADEVAARIDDERRMSDVRRALDRLARGRTRLAHLLAPGTTPEEI